MKLAKLPVLCLRSLASEPLQKCFLLSSAKYNCSAHPSSDTASEASATGPTPLSTRGPFSAELKSRGVVRFDGPDVIKFLQGLVTNDVTVLSSTAPESSASSPPAPNRPTATCPPVYAAALTPQGRFLYDFFLYRPNQGGQVLDRSGTGPGGEQDKPPLLADVDAQYIDELIEHLQKHKLRAKVNIEDASNDMCTWVRFSTSQAYSDEKSTQDQSGRVGWAGSLDTSAQAAAEADAEGWQWYTDPRLAALGERGLFPKNEAPQVEAEEMVEEAYYQLWRYEHGVAEGSTEIPKGEALPLEYNLDGLNAISFEKGCYVGQELTARTHSTGVVRKRLMPVQFVHHGNHESQRAAVPGVQVVSSPSGKKVGKVTAALGPRGLAHLRLEAALRGSSELKIDEEGGAEVKAERPRWWPSSWGQETVVENNSEAA